MGASSSAIPKLTQLIVTDGTVVGGHVPVMRESDGGFQILTRPVLFTEKVPALGTKADIGLYDFSKYAIGIRSQAHS